MHVAVQENHMMDRLRMAADTSDKIQHTVNQVVADVERIAQSHNISEQVNLCSLLVGVVGAAFSAQRALLG